MGQPEAQKKESAGLIADPQKRVNVQIDVILPGKARADLKLTIKPS